MIDAVCDIKERYFEGVPKFLSTDTVRLPEVIDLFKVLFPQGVSELHLPVKFALYLL